MLSSFFLFFIPWQSSDLIITKVKMIVKITKRERERERERDGSDESDPYPTTTILHFTLLNLTPSAEVTGSMGYKCGKK